MMRYGSMEMLNFNQINFVILANLIRSGTGNKLPPVKCVTTTTTVPIPRPRPQPIAGTPPPDPTERCDAKIIQQTCSLFGLDLVSVTEIIFVLYKRF